MPRIKSSPKRCRVSKLTSEEECEPDAVFTESLTISIADRSWDPRAIGADLAFVEMLQASRKIRTRVKEVVEKYCQQIRCIRYTETYDENTRAYVCCVYLFVYGVSGETVIPSELATLNTEVVVPAVFFKNKEEFAAMSQELLVFRKEEALCLDIWTESSRMGCSDYLCSHLDTGLKRLAMMPGHAVKISYNLETGVVVSYHGPFSQPEP